MSSSLTLKENGSFCLHSPHKYFQSAVSRVPFLPQKQNFSASAWGRGSWLVAGESTHRALAGRRPRDHRVVRLYHILARITGALVHLCKM